MCRHNLGSIDCVKVDASEDKSVWASHENRLSRILQKD